MRKKAGPLSKNFDTPDMGVGAGISEIDRGIEISRSAGDAGALPGLTWYSCLTGNIPEKIQLTEEALQLIRKAARDAVLTSK